MRTLVISDLHLGDWSGKDVLRHPLPRGRLLDALQTVDRLVVLGDLAELHGRGAHRSLAVSEPVLRALGARMAGREIILVPGNHDHPLVASWARATGSALTPSTVVPSGASEALDRVTELLGAARVTVRYPGVWLSERTYAIHGHYLDRHLIPDSAVGLLRPRWGDATRSLVQPADYERRRAGRSRWRPSSGRGPAEGDGSKLRRAIAAVRAALLFQLPPAILSPGMAPVTALVLDLQMRYATLPALGQVIRQLGIDADWVLFGHVHRLGPVSTDRPGPWRPGGRGPRFLNTGCWLYDPLLAERGAPPHPYWPGGGVMLEPGRDPRTVSLLDDLTRAELHGTTR